MFSRGFIDERNGFFRDVWVKLKFNDLIVIKEKFIYVKVCFIFKEISLRSILYELY